MCPAVSIDGQVYWNTELTEEKNSQETQEKDKTLHQGDTNTLLSSASTFAVGKGDMQRSEQQREQEATRVFDLRAEPTQASLWRSMFQVCGVAVQGSGQGGADGVCISFASDRGVDKTHWW